MIARAAPARRPCGGGRCRDRASLRRGRRPDLDMLLDMASAYELRFVETVRERRRRGGLRPGDHVPAPQAHDQDATSCSSSTRTSWARSSLRDVFEVDGKPVRDAAQAERMMKLFTSPVRRRRAPRHARLADEGRALQPAGTSARLNNPLVAMVFLQPDYRPRFRFNLAGIEKNLGPTVRTVRFESSACRPSCGPAPTSDLPSRGPDLGRRNGPAVWSRHACRSGTRAPSAGDRDHLPARRRARHRRAGRDARLVSGSATGEHEGRGHLRPLPALPGEDRRDTTEVGATFRWPMAGPTPARRR